MKMTSFQSARKKLVIVWLSMAGAVFIIFFIQSINGKYTDHSKEVWQWVFQYLTPAITLMIGVLIAEAMGGGSETQIDIFYYRLAIGVSLFFLFILFLSPVLVPFIHLRQNQNLSLEEQKSIIQAFKSFDNYLLPLQGISMLSLGLFFTNSK